MAQTFMVAVEGDDDFNNEITEKALAAKMSKQKYIAFVLANTHVVSVAEIVTSNPHVELQGNTNHVASHARQGRVRS